MRLIEADLHIHSALSPCAADEMTPEYIVYAAVAAELDMIALCDHNSAGNVGAVQEAARDIAGEFLCVLPGMEISTAEEAHVLALFPDAEQALGASGELEEHLPRAGPAGNPFGSQSLMDSHGAVIGTLDRLLSFASGLTLAETAALIRRHGGLAIAAHVDRPSFSVISQLGFMPDDIVFDAVEISAAGCAGGRQKDFADSGYPLVTASDAHFLENIGEGRIRLAVDHPSFTELKLALRGENGRTCRLA